MKCLQAIATCTCFLLNLDRNRSLVVPFFAITGIVPVKVYHNYHMVHFDLDVFRDKIGMEQLIPLIREIFAKKPNETYNTSDFHCGPERMEKKYY